MQAILEAFSSNAAEREDQEKLDHYKAILDMLQQSDAEGQPDWDEVASRWLDLIRPVWYEKLKQPRNKPLLLKDIRSDLLQQEQVLGPAIIDEFQTFPVMPSPDERISACIIGVP